MIQIKKTILTLVALLAVTTGAWAQTETLLTTITATAKEQASYSTANVATVSFSYTAEGYSVYNANWGWWGYGWIATVTAAEGYTITKCVFYDNDGATATDSTDPFIVETEEENKKPKVNGATFGAFTSAGIKKIEVYGYETPAASSGPEVAWNQAEKTGSFTMPGGNVTLEPEYYPQATLTAAPTPSTSAKATTDDLLVSGGTVANIGETTTAQGTVMYYVSLTNMSTEALLALDADKWVAEPTAAGIPQKCVAYVYYYVKGNNSTDDALNFSDGDITSDNLITVDVLPAPTYSVTFADDLAEPTLWTADPNTDVTKGQTVTVTYTGSKKVIGVKAEKKAAAPLSESFTTNQKIETYDGNHFTITCIAKGDSDGIEIDNSKPLTITAKNGETITKVEFHSTYGKQYASQTTVTAGTLNWTNLSATGSIDNVNASTVSMSNSTKDWVQINQITVYYTE